MRNKALLIYPEFPEDILELRKDPPSSSIAKVLLPPLAMVTVAALLPQQLGVQHADSQRQRRFTEAEVELGGAGESFQG